MGYPPLLYWSFAWVRLLSFSMAYLVWAAVIVAGTFLSTLAWAPPGRRRAAEVLFSLLLLLQYPLLFSVERGNSDVLVLILWTVAMGLFVSGRFAMSGLVAAITAALKIYPAFPAIVVGGGILWWAWKERAARPILLRFAAGGVATSAIVLLLTFDQTLAYLSDEFVRFASSRHGLGPWTHTLYPIAPGGASWLLSSPLLLAWLLAAGRRLPDDPVIIFAGGLAISTYFPPVSNDYNLVTAYPLLMVLFVRALSERSSRLTAALLVLGLVAIIGNRWLFMWSEPAMALRVWLQWLWLALTAVAAAAGRLKDASPARVSTVDARQAGRDAQVIGTIARTHRFP
jgi:hypothetical protein